MERNVKFLEHSVPMASPSSSSNGNEEVVIKIKNGLQRHAAAAKSLRRKTKSTMYRVRPRVRKLKPNYYTPELVSLGLFNRLDFPKTRADEVRLALASAYMDILGMTENEDWEKLCAKVVEDPKEMQELYDYDYINEDENHHNLSPEVVRSVLTLDAIFVSCFFGAKFCTEFAKKFPAFEVILLREGTTFFEILLYDIVQLENQIPLSLIRKALLILYEKKEEPEAQGAAAGDEAPAELARNVLNCVFRGVVDRHVERLPGSGLRAVDLVPAEECAHLMEFLYRAIARGEAGPADDLYDEKTLPSVSQLRDAGISFQGHGGSISDVFFSPGLFTATLYIPALNIIEDNTEPLWRNVVAYEGAVDQGSGERYEFGCFLEFMDDLIDTENDVQLLRKGKNPVIRRNFLGHDKHVAPLFYALLQNCYIQRSPRWNEIRVQILSFYNQKHRRLYVEFMRTNFGKPWVAASVIAATVLLILTTLQTLYAMLSFY